MYNDWLTIGPLTVHGYGVMIAIGILAAFFVAERNARKHGLDADQVDNIILMCLLVGFIFAKITYILTNWNDFLLDPWTYLGADGWVVYGGIIGGILGAWIWCRIKKLPFYDYLNLLFPVVAMAQGFGRIGCFFAGCCYGKQTNGAFGVVFPEGSLAPSGVKLIPTQLISSAGDFILFYLLYNNYNKGEHPDDTAALYLIFYSCGRFLIEFLRGDTIRGFIGPLSTSQFIAIFVFAAGLILLAVNRKNRKTVKENVQ